MYDYESRDFKSLTYTHLKKKKVLVTSIQNNFTDKVKSHESFDILYLYKCSILVLLMKYNVSCKQKCHFQAFKDLYRPKHYFHFCIDIFFMH